jgi:hypothetical protein
VFEWIKDKYLTWRTGYDKEQRIWYKWRDETIVSRAGDVTNMFMNFKHVFIIDPNKFFDLSEPFGWVPLPSAKQYLWPQRELGDNSVYYFARVHWNQWDRRWHFDEMGGEDRLFIATNNDKDATMIALKYS